MSSCVAVVFGPPLRPCPLGIVSSAIPYSRFVVVFVAGLRQQVCYSPLLSVYVYCFQPEAARPFKAKFPSLSKTFAPGSLLK